MNGGVAVGVGTDVGDGIAVFVAVAVTAGWVTVLAGSSDWDVLSHAANRTASTSDAAATANTHLSFIVRPMGLSMGGCVVGWQEAPDGGAVGMTGAAVRGWLHSGGFRILRCAQNDMRPCADGRQTAWGDANSGGNYGWCGGDVRLRLASRRACKVRQAL